MILDLCHSKFLKESNEEVYASSLSPTIKLQIVLFWFPYISYRSSGENLFEYQQNLTWEIMFSIVMKKYTEVTQVVGRISLNINRI